MSDALICTECVWSGDRTTLPEHLVVHQATAVSR
jgi:hypothetical protein